MASGLGRDGVIRSSVYLIVDLYAVNAFARQPRDSGGSLSSRHDFECSRPTGWVAVENRTAAIHVRSHDLSSVQGGSERGDTIFRLPHVSYRCHAVRKIHE